MIDLYVKCIEMGINCSVFGRKYYYKPCCQTIKRFSNVSFNSNRTGVTRGEGTAKFSGAPVFSLGF